MKKFKFRHPSDRVLIFVAMVIIGSITGVLWSYGQRLNTLWQQNNSISNSTSSINPYIQSALKGLYPYQPVTDPQDKRVYFPEASLYVPMTSVSRQLVYGYNAADGDSPEQLIITSVSNINDLPNSLADVHCLQRHITVIFDSTAGGDGRLAITKQLANGQTMYVYEHQAGSCTGERWAGYSGEDIVSLLDQSQSY